MIPRGWYRYVQVPLRFAQLTELVGLFEGSDVAGVAVIVPLADSQVLVEDVELVRVVDEIGEPEQYQHVFGFLQSGVARLCVHPLGRTQRLCQLVADVLHKCERLQEGVRRRSGTGGFTSEILLMS